MRPGTADFAVSQVAEALDLKSENRSLAITSHRNAATEARPTSPIIAENVGYESLVYFPSVFHQLVDCTPREYRRGAGNRQ